MRDDQLPDRKKGSLIIEGPVSRSPGPKRKVGVYWWEGYGLYCVRSSITGDGGGIFIVGR